MVNKGAVAKATQANKYKALVSARKARPVERKLVVRQVVHPEHGVLALCASGTGTFAVKHLLNGKTVGYPKGHWLSAKAVAEKFPQMPPTWVESNSWWHFQDITVPGGTKEMQELLNRLLVDIRKLTLIEGEPLHMEIEEQTVNVEDADMDILAEIWPTLHNE